MDKIILIQNIKLTTLIYIRFKAIAALDVDAFDRTIPKLDILARRCREFLDQVIL